MWNEKSQGEVIIKDIMLDSDFYNIFITALQARCNDDQQIKHVLKCLYNNDPTMLLECIDIIPHIALVNWYGYLRLTIRKLNKEVSNEVCVYKRPNFNVFI